MSFPQKPKEVMAGLGLPESNKLEDLKNKRFGYIDLGRKVDELVQYAVELFPGKELPRRFSAASQTRFVKKHGEGVFWSKSSACHTLFFSGNYVARFWTDAASSLKVDVAEHILTQTPFEIHDIAESTWRKTKPFKKRCVLTSKDEVEQLIKVIKRIYGLDS